MQPSNRYDIADAAYEVIAAYVAVLARSPESRYDFLAMLRVPATTDATPDEQARAGNDAQDAARRFRCRQQHERLHIKECCPCTRRKAGVCHDLLVAEDRQSLVKPLIEGGIHHIGQQTPAGTAPDGNRRARRPS